MIRATWAEVSAYFNAEHKLGEHVAIEGPTGSGKTVLLLLLVEGRAKLITRAGRPVHATVFATKAEDRTLKLLGADWRVMRDLKEWPPPYGSEHVVLWPARSAPIEQRSRTQARIFRSVLDEMLRPGVGRQIVAIDEVAYFEDPQPTGLGLRTLITRYWRESRSSQLSLFAGTQRPSWVSRYMWTEPYWLFLFRPEDEEDLKRVAQLSGFRETVLEVLPRLGAHEFLMLSRRPVRTAVVSQVEL